MPATDDDRLRAFVEAAALAQLLHDQLEQPALTGFADEAFVADLTELHERLLVGIAARSAALASKQ
jgi:hypothetical protein